MTIVVIAGSTHVTPGISLINCPCYRGLYALRLETVVVTIVELDDRLLVVHGPSCCRCSLLYYIVLPFRILGGLTPACHHGKFPHGVYNVAGDVPVRLASSSPIFVVPRLEARAQYCVQQESRCVSVA